ncbi:hypothetical protein [Pseudomonas avellanae]|uniref:hypothetical protein n=1 Tax=Pseudomonas avellanae TaxID=46257 RepID=UPI001F51D4B8|nr:hypothetical protein [Pseudomonas avellanae]
MSVTTVTDSSFQKDVIEASNQGLVVVEFSTKGKVNKRGEENASARMDAIFDALEEKYAERSAWSGSRSNWIRISKTL